ncbi:hypothetical protein B0H34DRAFT_738272 [Crassisporium funariophilum]|nr:hypothetical protein B0H34DRAFT_738272 [Crassisporium funariophilum]
MRAWQNPKNRLLPFVIWITPPAAELIRPQFCVLHVALCLSHFPSPRCHLDPPSRFYNTRQVIKYTHGRVLDAHLGLGQAPTKSWDGFL